MDPMSSFAVKNLIPIDVFGLDISITNSSLYMLLVVLLICLVLFLGTSDKGFVPGKLQAIVEGLFFFTGDVVKTNISKQSVAFFPYMISLFLFVMVGNIIGLFPFAFSFTSQLVVTFGMAIIVFIASIVLGFYNQGLKYFRHFCPEGVPLALAPLFIPIELMSFLFRPITLGMRLFVNMMAGHVMIEVIAGFAVSIAGVAAFSYFAAIPIIVNILLNVFKLAVCILQAYVFVVLSCVYLSESVEEPAH